MARVPYPQRDDYPSAHRAAYDRMLRERGDPPLNIFSALANIPNLLDPLLTSRARCAREPSSRRDYANWPS